MSTKDRFIIVIVLILVAIFAFSLKAEAGITINGVTIGCEFELAKYASEHPYEFVTADTGTSIYDEQYSKWFRGETLNLHNVTSNCCSCGKNATISWNTAHCINHNQGASNINSDGTESSGSKPWIVTILEIEWDKNNNCYRYQGKHGDGATSWYYDNRIKNVVRGISLATANDPYGKYSGDYGMAMAREFNNIFKGRSDIINEYFTHSYKLNARIKRCVCISDNYII